MTNRNGARRLFDALPQPLTIPDVMTLRKLAGVLKLLGHLPAAHRKNATWRYVAERLDDPPAADETDPRRNIPAQAGPKAIVGFPAEVCESERGDGKKVSPARS
jgi:hypothetical protein